LVRLVVDINDAVLQILQLLVQLTFLLSLRVWLQDGLANLETRVEDGDADQHFQKGLDEEVPLGAQIRYSQKEAEGHDEHDDSEDEVVLLVEDVLLQLLLVLLNFVLCFDQFKKWSIL
jgi:hypothetical protein